MELPPVPPPSTAPSAALILEARAKAWRQGHIWPWKLDASQQALYKEILSKRVTTRAVVLAGRGWGKSYLDLLMLIETCLQGIPVKGPDGKVTHIEPANVAFVTKTKKQGVENIRQTATTILGGCPRSIMPIWQKTDSQYVFKNGSTLSILGVDSERFDFLRGRALDGVVIDEAQDIDQLAIVTRVILDPCVLRRRGWMVLSGTVPQRDTHEFLEFIREAAGKEALVVRSSMDAPRYTPEEKENWKDRAGGENSSTWRREYMCEMVFDDTRAVIGEWNLERSRRLTKEVPRPEACDKYVGLDFGFARDLTVAVFGFWDFATASLVIEDEVVAKSCTTATLAKLIEDKMTELWGPAETRTNVHLWADGNEQRTIHEFKVLHKLPFRATDKKDKKASINGVKILVAQERLIVNARCKTLISTLFAATWNKNFDSYTREAETGHGDALDALCYLFRNVKQNKNPFVQHPAHWSNEGRAGKPPLSSAAKTLGSCFEGEVVDIRRAVAGKLGRRR